jgi:hypothetical protein
MSSPWRAAKSVWGLDRFGVPLLLLVLGERPVDAGHGGFFPLRLPVAMD